MEPSLEKMNRPRCSEIHERWFVIIALPYDSCPKSVFTRYSGFPDSNLPRVCLENESETSPRGQKRVVDMTDGWSTLLTLVYSNAEPNFEKKIDHR